MSDVKILHNPRCSKSRQTLSLIEEKGIKPEIVLYLESPPSVAELKELQDMLELQSARDFMRTKEEIYKQLNLKGEQDENKLLEAMSENPKLIERPIVITNGKARLGRPPETVLEIL